jgi:hypothetical protein
MTKLSPIIISFIGPVGVGKSTQIKLLKKYLRSRGEKTVDTYLKSAHGSTYLLANLIGLLSKSIHSQSDSEASRNRRAIHIAFSPLWNASETVSIVGKFLLNVYLPFTFGYNVLIEEGLIMSIENYKSFRPHILGVRASDLPFLSTLLRWSDSRRHLYIILDVGDEEVASRRMSRTFRRSESDDYVGLQRTVMSKLSGPDVLVVETSGKSIEEVHKIIVDRMREND